MDVPRALAVYRVRAVVVRVLAISAKNPVVSPLPNHRMVTADVAT